MAQLNLRPILSGDTTLSLIDKINFNFQQIALNGGGPIGKPGLIGGPGYPGPIGPVGPIGMKGATGSYTFAGILAPNSVTLTPVPKEDDLYLQTDNDTNELVTWKFISNLWEIQAMLSMADSTFNISGGISLPARAIYPSPTYSQNLLLANTDAIGVTGMIFADPQSTHPTFAPYLTPDVGGWLLALANTTNQIRLVNTSDVGSSDRGNLNAGVNFSLQAKGATELLLTLADASILGSANKYFSLDLNQLTDNSSAIYSDSKNFTAFGALRTGDTILTSRLTSISKFTDSITSHFDGTYNNILGTLSDVDIKLTGAGTIDNVKSIVSKLYVGNNSNALHHYAQISSNSLEQIEINNSTGSTTTVAEVSQLKSDYIKLTGTVNITNAYGLNLSHTTDVASTSRISNYYGLYIGDTTGTGTITNLYGIYQQDIHAKNIFYGASTFASAFTANGLGTFNGSLKVYAFGDEESVILLGADSVTNIVTLNPSGTGSTLFGSDVTFSKAPQFPLGLSAAGGTFNSRVLFNAGFTSAAAGFTGLVSFIAGLSATGATFTSLVKFSGGLSSTGATFTGNINFNSAFTSTGATFTGQVVLTSTAPTPDSYHAASTKYVDAKVVNTTLGTGTTVAPSELQVKTYIDAKVVNTALSTGTTVAPSELQVKTYVDAKVIGSDSWTFITLANPIQDQITFTTKISDVLTVGNDITHMFGSSVIAAGYTVAQIIDNYTIRVNDDTWNINYVNGSPVIFYVPMSINTAVAPSELRVRNYVDNTRYMKGALLSAAATSQLFSVPSYATARGYYNINKAYSIIVTPGTGWTGGLNSTGTTKAIGMVNAAGVFTGSWLGYIIQSSGGVGVTPIELVFIEDDTTDNQYILFSRINNGTIADTQRCTVGSPFVLDITTGLLT